MKQETINLIKSMTGKGFLIIVDPEKVKGDGVFVTLTVEDYTKKHESDC